MFVSGVTIVGLFLLHLASEIYEEIQKQKNKPGLNHMPDGSICLVAPEAD